MIAMPTQKLHLPSHPKYIIAKATMKLIASPTFRLCCPQIFLYATFFTVVNIFSVSLEDVSFHASYAYVCASRWNVQVGFQCCEV